MPINSSRKRIASPCRRFFAASSSPRRLQVRDEPAQVLRVRIGRRQRLLPRLAYSFEYLHLFLQARELFAGALYVLERSGVVGC